MLHVTKCSIYVCADLAWADLGGGCRGCASLRASLRVLARLASLAQIGELTRRLGVRTQYN